MLSFIVEDTYAGCRLDKFIFSQQHETLYSRSLIEKLIEREKVYVNDKCTHRKSYLLKENDVITIQMPTAELDDIAHPKSENIPIDIIYEDNYLAIVNKPAGLTVHPAPGNHTGTLVNALLHHFDMSNHTERNRPGIVHRLDKDTSGLMVIAKDEQTLYELSKLFMDRQIEKKYLCLCCGVPNPQKGTIATGIGRHKTDRKRMAVKSEGKVAITHFEVISDFEHFSLIAVTIETGRTHQIRVHLEHINHPVIGDDVYNSQKRTLAYCPINKQKKLNIFISKHINRQLLHASKLSFVHPKTQELMSWESTIPKDMKICIDRFKSLDD
jgi:23S rRNA pseudouridine1911/1915/1917 synthase